MEIFVQIFGWAGTFLIVLAYLLISFKKMDGDNKVYHLMNLFGAVGVGINTFYYQAWPAFVLQAVWGTIAILTLIRLIVKNKAKLGL